ncbi:MAG: fumarylacetoacetate hydrolase family protein [Methanotrichaceae archaeon]|nr:fumarylacetoacetate hydrolase family protein [Methanotrichaceae archaeon]
MLVRFNYNGGVLYGSLVGEKIISSSDVYDLTEVELLSPCQPTKIVCIGLNYVEHASELKMQLPEEPIIFIKPPSAAIGPGAEILLPSSSKQVDYEGELAVVISKRSKNISARFATDYILGYTCFNDVTARDLQKKDGQWTRAKSFDTFAPLGPWITDINSSEADIKTRVNGELKQDSNTSDLIFSVPVLVEFISQIMTLEAGDVIATGTPPGVGSLQKGDIVEIEIEGIGILKNLVSS